MFEGIVVMLFLLCECAHSPEGKSVVEDKLSEVAASLLAAYDGGEIVGALEEGPAGWQKWVKSFGKSLKRKVRSKWMILLFLFHLRATEL